MTSKFKDRVFDWIIMAILIVLAALCLFPFINILAISLSSNSAILGGKVSIFPVGFQILAYKAVLKDAAMIRAFVFTVFLTGLYTVVTVTTTICAAYPLSKENLKGRKIFLMIIIFTMYFSGGMIPTYLVVNNLHLINSMWALILPGMMSVFYMIIMKSYFTTAIPPSLEEAATIDGCSTMNYLIKILIPLSKPVLAAIALFYAVNRWNGFMDALYYINDPEKYPMQLKLRQIISLSQVDQMQMDIQTEAESVVPEALKSASIIFGTVPILLIYPFLQKYFISGIMLGSVKG